MTQFAFPAMLTEQDGLSATVVAYDTRPEAVQPIYQADSSHPHFDEIVAGLRSGDPNVWDLFDVATGIMARFTKVTDRVSWNGSEVLFDGDPIHNTLSEQLGRAMREGKRANFEALARFWERLEANPVAHSREQAYDFLASHAFQITADGLIVAFKGVDADGAGGYRSRRRSEAPGLPSGYADGVPVPPLTHVPNNLGTVVSMPRSEVQHDPSVSCARGLHVSTRSYANGWGTVVLEVHVDPAAIVSVPNHEGEKVRVHEYKVVRVADTEDAYGHSTVLAENSADRVTWAGNAGTRV
jgi:hypothetical protein